MRVNASSPACPCALDQRADDFVHVAAGAEVAARAGDHHALDRVRIDEVAERVAQLGIGLRTSAGSCARAG